MKITVRCFDTTAEVDGCCCGVPGLAVTRWVTGESLNIVHLRSGTVICWFPGADPEAVLAAARELGTLAGWDVPGTRLQADRGLAAQAARVARRWGGLMTGGAGVPAADLPETGKTATR